MGFLGRSLYLTAVVLVLMTLLLDEAEARRKVLRGRKTMTTYYYSKPAIPAWAIVTIVAFCMIIVGGIVYAIMRKVILGGTNSDEYEPVTA